MTISKVPKDGIFKNDEKMAKRWHKMTDKYFYPDNSMGREVAAPIGTAANFSKLSSLYLKFFTFLGYFRLEIDRLQPNYKLDREIFSNFH
jgi:hypothetical protein